MSPLQLGLLYLNIAGEAALLLRLLFSGLAGIYVSLFLFLTADLAEMVGLAVIPLNTKLYGSLYMAGQAVNSVLAVFVVLELYWLALEGHPALARYGRKTVGYVLAAAAAIAACLLVVGHTVPTGQSPVLHNFFSFERTMDVWVLIFLVAISIFMSWFPVRLRRNVAFYIGGFLVYFFSRASGLMLVNLLPPRFQYPVDTAVGFVQFACLLVWLFALRREGEETTTVIGHGWNPAAMERLTAQLASINASLERLSRP